MTKCHRTLAVLLSGLAAFSSASYADGDLTIADFESPTYAPWKVEGTAFGMAPATGTRIGQMSVGGFQGKGLVNSYNGGDVATGKLTSPPFVIARHFINFLIGGGMDANKLALRLRVGGQIVRTATGPNGRPGGSEQLDWSSWDVAEYKGQSATLEIIDDATGGWGHINVDSISQSDTRKSTESRERTLVATDPVLLLPVKNGAPMRTVAVIVGGKELRHFDIELADGDPDWWAPLDISAWKGQTLTLNVSALPPDSHALTQIKQSSTWSTLGETYSEPQRGQFHFSSRVGWLNDPNGMVYSQGLYHLFYQHNPYGWNWGNMHWGHAVSPDMVHWRELPIALYPHAAGDDVYSGSAIVDKANTSGWKKGDNDLLVAAYTSTGRGECITYSNDRGLTWTEYEGNPVVVHAGEGRDPRLLWHEPTHQWVMVVWDHDESQPIPDNRGGIKFYTSTDLKHWTFQSRIGGFFECPDLFELPTEEGQKKWVLTGASSDYRIGTFDGKQFVSQTPKLVGHRGRGYYAAQTFSDEPQGRHVQIGWFQTETRGGAFNQSMSLPSELRLKSTPAGPRLTWNPVRELESLRSKTHSCAPLTLAEDSANPLSSLQTDLVEIRAEFDPATANEIAFDVRGVPVVYDATRGEIIVAGQHAPAPLQAGKQHLTIYLDRTGIEVYASDGLTFVPFPIIVKPEEKSLSLTIKGGTATFSRLDVYELKSAWDKN